jgi:hypothetical protein
MPAAPTKPANIILNLWSMGKASAGARRSKATPFRHTRTAGSLYNRIGRRLRYLGTLGRAFNPCILDEKSLIVACPKETRVTRLLDDEALLSYRDPVEPIIFF